MRKFYAIAGVGILGACLASWAALARAQQAPVPPPNPPAPIVPVSAPVPAPAAPPKTVPIPAPAVPETTAPLPKHVPSSAVVPPPPSASGIDTLVPLVPSASHIPETIPAVPVRSEQPIHPPAVAPTAPTAPTPRTSLLPPSEDKSLEPTTTLDNPTGRQEPAVSIEWVGPPNAKIGQAGEYTLVVHNTCNTPVDKVQVRVHIPAGIKVGATEPKAEMDGDNIVWPLGTMTAKQEKNLQMKLIAETKGDLLPQASVTFTGTTVLRVRVREPKLILHTSAPDKVLVGDAATFTLTVSNPGDGSTDQVKIHAVLSEGLEHARGNKFDFEIGSLAPGESRSVQVICGTKAGGPQKCEAVADADGGMKSADVASVNVIMPRLDMQIVGPGLKYLERKAIYTLKVTNPGDAPATNVTVSDVVPVGFKVLAASDGGRHDFSTRAVSWFVGEVGPGQTKQVQLEVQAINTGDFMHKASAIGARGLRAESQCHTKVEGLSALMIEMVDTEDPIEAGGDTAYEIRITNTGSKTETDIKLIAMVPEKMSFKSAQGPVKFREDNKQVVFEPLEKLAPKADAIFRINVKAVEAGTVRFKIQVTSANIVEPIIKMEPTRIYDDSPQSATPAPKRVVVPPAPLPPSLPMPPH